MPIIGVIASSVAKSSPAYESIQTVTLGSNTNTVSFSSIPQTYKHLQVRIRNRMSYNSGQDYFGFSIRINGGSGSFYSYLGGTGATSSVQSFRSNGDLVGVAPSNSITTTQSATIVDLWDYTDTTKWRTYASVTGFDNNASSNGFSAVYTGYWGATSAITSLQFVEPNTYNFVTGSTFALYGIKG